MKESRASSVLIGLGSNQGRPLEQLEAAVAALRADPDLAVTSVSPWYRSRPVGGPPGQPDFLNGVLAARTRLLPEELLARLQRIESSFGRARSRELRHGPRPLDLDLLFYDDVELDLPHLVLPHPRVEERAFVLVPLADVAPERRLPSGLTVRERLAELSLEGVVREPAR